jgi:ABC-type taurine transport system substrate-binding protein
MVHGESSSTCKEMSNDAQECGAGSPRNHVRAVRGSCLHRSRASAQTPLPITIGYQATADWLLLAARDLQLFEQADLAPTYVKFVAGAPMIAAVQSKTIDVAAVGSVPFLIGLSQGVDWVMIGIHSEGAYAERFLRALVIAYGVLHKDPTVGVRALAAWKRSP